MIFNVGDYIGDESDTCWKVEAVTEKEYTVAYIPANIRKTISREEKPHRWSHDKDYAEDYHILRTYDHPDVTHYPIGSVWKCNNESGLNNPLTDTVTIMDYALSKGRFWVCNTKKGFLFLAEAEDLEPVDRQIKADCGQKMTDDIEREF